MGHFILPSQSIWFWPHSQIRPNHPQVRETNCFHQLVLPGVTQSPTGTWGQRPGPSGTDKARPITQQVRGANFCPNRVNRTVIQSPTGTWGQHVSSLRAERGCPITHRYVGPTGSTRALLQTNTNHPQVRGANSPARSCPLCLNQSPTGTWGQHQDVVKEHWATYLWVSIQAPQT